MRMLLKASIPTASGNAAIEKGTLGPTIETALAALKPETAFFGVENGMRTAFIVFDMKANSDMPPVGEPFFMELGAQVTFTPVMTPEDLRKGLSQLG